MATLMAEWGQKWSPSNTSPEMKNEEEVTKTCQIHQFLPMQEPLSMATAHPPPPPPPQPPSLDEFTAITLYNKVTMLQQ
jgi:hypothetical protein